MRTVALLVFAARAVAEIINSRPPGAAVIRRPRFKCHRCEIGEQVVGEVNVTARGVVQNHRVGDDARPAHQGAVGRPD